MGQASEMPRPLPVLVLLCAALSACGGRAASVSEGSETSEAESESSTTEDTASGDGDGDRGGDGDGEGSGDGDGEGSGDGDGEATGDGDGEGSGDGDGDGCEACESTDCLEATCEAGSCTYVAVAPCEGLDDVVDISVRLVLAGEDPLLTPYTPGTQLRLYGDTYNCEEDCSATDWSVMRDAEGELIAAYFDTIPRDPEVLALLGETPDSWLSPLALSLEDQGYCEFEPLSCEEGSEPFRRGTFDLLHPDEGSARLLDASIGWAGGGYFVSARRWRVGQDDPVCELFVPASAMLHRSACGEDCPPPTVVDSCAPALEGVFSFFSLRVQRNSPAHDSGGPYAADCVVLEAPMEPGDAGLEISLALDCTFTVAQ